MALPVFRQRLLLSSDAFVRGVSADRIIESILDRTAVPEYRTSP
jgi:MoxR-like ATPase